MGRLIEVRKARRPSWTSLTETPSWYEVVKVKVYGFYPQLSLRRLGFLFMIVIMKKVKIKIARKKITFTLFLFSLCTVVCSPFTVSYAETPGRIISLAPSLTEILFAAGLGDRLVGVTTFCDYPEEAKKKLRIGGMSNPSLEAVVTLKPDIVIMTTDGNPREFEQRLHSINIKTHVFKAVTLSELPDGIRKIGIELDEKKRFDSLASEIEDAFEKFKGRGRQTEPKKKVLFIIWPEPLVVAGPRTAADDVITLLGAVNVAGEAKTRYPKYSIEEIIRQAPDIIVIGKMLEDSRNVSGRLLERISGVAAVKNKKVFYVGDSLYRLGPRVIEGMEELERYLRN